MRYVDALVSRLVAAVPMLLVQHREVHPTELSQLRLSTIYTSEDALLESVMQTRCLLNDNVFLELILHAAQYADPDRKVFAVQAQIYKMFSPRHVIFLS